MEGQNNINVSNIKMEKFVRDLEKKFKTKGLYRHIQVVPATATKKKQVVCNAEFSGDHSNYTPEKIVVDRGNPTGNTFSIAMKHCKTETTKLVCVDFDNKTICHEMPLFKQLHASGTYFTETTNGYHFYINVKDAPNYSNEVKVGAVVDGEAKEFQDIDLICKKRNVWETKDRILSGTKFALYGWSSLQKFFNVGKMNINAPVGPLQGEIIDIAPIQHQNPVMPVAVDEEMSRCDETTLVEIIGRLSETRYEYDDWIRVGAVCYNNFDDKNIGWNIWNDWSRKGQSYNMSHLNQSWNTFTNAEIEGAPITWKTLRFWANEDNPLNKWKTLYESGGRDAVVSEMNKTISFCRKTSEYIFEYGEEIDMKTKGQMGQEFEDMGFIVDIDGDDKMLNPFKLWVTDKRRRKYIKVVFDPKRLNDTEYYNLWKGYKMTAENTADANEKLAKPLLDHIFRRWCKGNREHYNYVMSWFASKLQKPWIKLATVICLKSKEGSGKNIVLNFFKEIMGDYYTSVSNINIVLGDFNGYTKGKMLIDLDEVSYGGNKAQNNKLKAFITEDETIVNEKNKEAYKIDNFSDSIMTTNEDYFIGVTENSRRYFCLELDNYLCGVQDAGKRKYIDDILAVPPEAFAKCLYAWDVTGFNSRKFARTDLFMGQCMLNWTSDMKFWHKVLHSNAMRNNLKYNRGYSGNDSNDNGFKGGFHVGNSYWYVADSLYQLYIESDLGGYATRVPPQSFHQKLSELFGGHIVEKHHAKHGRVIKLPKIELARECFNENQQYQFDWGNHLEEFTIDGEDTHFFNIEEMGDNDVQMDN